MRINCTQCDGKRHRQNDLILMVNISEQITNSEGKTVLFGRCEVCGQGYEKELPENIKIK